MADIAESKQDVLGSKRAACHLCSKLRVCAGSFEEHVQHLQEDDPQEGSGASGV